MKIYRDIITIVWVILQVNRVASHVSAIETVSNKSEDVLHTQHDEVVYRNKSEKRVIPIMFSRSTHPDLYIECSKSMEQFPSFFTDEQRRHGAIIIPFVVAVYCFTLIAIICDSYFLPCVERICEALDLSRDVAAATFMAIATSAPELFVNVIGTFITESDIGIGTVVGSSMFNTLGVASLGGLFASSPIQLDWWPLTRDIVMYILSIMLLVILIWDGVIRWYESMTLCIVYGFYLIIMFQNVRISNFIRRCSKPYPCQKKVSDVEPVKINVEEGSINCSEGPINRYSEQINDSKGVLDDKDEDNNSLFKFPNGTCLEKLFFIYAWPIRFILFCTVPDCRKHKTAYPLTFLMCVFWIGSNTYIISWMITIIGSTLGIGDSILGLTFLAAGGCLPEAISITITSRRGEGAMGISNALGANTINILLSLGLPWFVKTAIIGKTMNSQSIRIESGSIEYTILALIIVALVLYVTLYANKFRLSKLSGTILIIFYIIFIVLAICSEIFLFAKPECTNS